MQYFNNLETLNYEIERQKYITSTLADRCSRLYKLSGLNKEVLNKPAPFKNDQQTADDSNGEVLQCEMLQKVLNEAASARHLIAKSTSSVVAAKQQEPNLTSCKWVKQSPPSRTNNVLASSATLHKKLPHPRTTSGNVSNHHRTCVQTTNIHRSTSAQTTTNNNHPSTTNQTTNIHRSTTIQTTNNNHPSTTNQTTNKHLKRLTCAHKPHTNTLVNTNNNSEQSTNNNNINNKNRSNSINNKNEDNLTHIHTRLKDLSIKTGSGRPNSRALHLRTHCPTRTQVATKPSPKLKGLGAEGSLLINNCNNNISSKEAIVDDDDDEDGDDDDDDASSTAPQTLTHETLDLNDIGPFLRLPGSYNNLRRQRGRMLERFEELGGQWRHVNTSHHSHKDAFVRKLQLHNDEGLSRSLKRMQLKQKMVACMQSLCALLTSECGGGGGACGCGGGCVLTGMKAVVAAPSSTLLLYSHSTQLDDLSRLHTHLSLLHLHLSVTSFLNDTLPHLQALNATRKAGTAADVGRMCRLVQMLCSNKRQSLCLVADWREGGGDAWSGGGDA